MLASRVTCGHSGVFPGDRGKCTVIGGVDLVQDLVGRVDDVRPERKVLSKGELHSGVAQRGVGDEGDKRGERDGKAPLPTE